jgi:hypothetical protein
MGAVIPIPGRLAADCQKVIISGRSLPINETIMGPEQNLFRLFAAWRRPRCETIANFLPSSKG